MSFCLGHLPPRETDRAPEERPSTQSGPWALRLAHLPKYTEVWALGRRERPGTSFSRTREDLLVSPMRRRRGSGSRSRWQAVGGRCDGAPSRPLRSRRAVQGRWPAEEGCASQRGSSHRSTFFWHEGTDQRLQCGRCRQRSLTEGGRAAVHPVSKSVPPGSEATSWHHF